MEDDRDDVPATSQLARLRAKAEKARRTQFVDVHLEPIDVMIRYVPISRERLDVLIKRNRDGNALTTATLVEACQAIFAIEDGDAVSIDPDGHAGIDEDGQVTGQPVTFASPKLAELLEADGEKGPELVNRLYGLANLTLQIPRDSDDVVFLSRGETERMTRPPGVSGAA